MYFAKDYYLSESDQYPFHVHEKPFLFFIRVEKDEEIPDLHQKTDTVDKISKDVVSSTIDMFFKILGSLSYDSLN